MTAGFRPAEPTFDTLPEMSDAGGVKGLILDPLPASTDVRPGRRWIDRLPGWIRGLAAIGALPDDDEDERLRKASLVLTSIAVVALAIIWVATYAALGFYVSAAVPFTFQVVTVVSLIGLKKGWRFSWFRTSQLAIWLVLPFLLQWSLGGFVAGSGVMLWSLVSPLGALVLSTRPTPLIFAYLVLTALSGVLEPVLTPVAMPLPIVVLFFVLNIGGVSVVIFSLLRYFMVRLVAERAKSELLLLNVLPQPIASRLKAGERPIADHIDEAAVLFADLVGFTPLTEEMSPADLIDLLDHLFSEFDGLAAARGLEKIKTVGDAYMVVGGVPAPREDAAEDIAAMALDMLKVAGAHQRSDGEHLQLRIGIDVGPVVAGVIGHQKFTYDLWGDTVNTASRMESHGIPGYIQVTPRAYERLRGRFSFEQREPVEIKGKGLMSPLLLTEHRALDSIQE